MARIEVEGDFELPTTQWEVTLVGGPNDGAIVIAPGYPSSIAPGLTVLEIARQDGMPEVGLVMEVREEVQLRYELVPGTLRADLHSAEFRYVP